MSWFISNSIVAALLALGVWLFAAMRRREYWRLAGRELLAKKSAVVSGAILAAYLLVAVLDSVGWRNAERDPATGDLYSIELLLARNSFRQIAIFEKLGDAAGAAKAREDARAYFVKAVARAVADKDEKTAEFVRRQMADCGFAAGGN